MRSAGAEWLRRLPGPAHRPDGRAGRSSPTGEVRWGAGAVAVPVTSPSGPAVLKVTWPHHEALTEHLGLRHWDGHGCGPAGARGPAPVRAAARTPRRGDRPALAAGGRRLRGHRGPPRAAAIAGPAAGAHAHGVCGAPARRSRRPSTCCRGGSSSRVAGSRPSSSTDPDVDAWLLHTDLHYENVLRGTRQPWLAIDPKPTAGDRAFEVAPALWNRADELGTGSSVRWNLRRRLEIVCEHADIDEDRAKAWTIVREVDNATDPAEGSGPGQSRRGDHQGDERLTVAAAGSRASRARTGPGVAVSRPLSSSSRVRGVPERPRSRSTASRICSGEAALGSRTSA